MDIAPGRGGAVPERGAHPPGGAASPPRGAAIAPGRYGIATGRGDVDPGRGDGDLGRGGVVTKGGGQRPREGRISSPGSPGRVSLYSSRSFLGEALVPLYMEWQEETGCDWMARGDR